MRNCGGAHQASKKLFFFSAALPPCLSRWQHLKSGMQHKWERNPLSVALRPRSCHQTGPQSLPWWGPHKKNSRRSGKRKAKNPHLVLPLRPECIRHPATPAPSPRLSPFWASPCKKPCKSLVLCSLSAVQMRQSTKLCFSSSSRSSPPALLPRRLQKKPDTATRMMMMTSPTTKLHTEEILPFLLFLLLRCVSYLYCFASSSCTSSCPSSYVFRQRQRGALVPFVVRKLLGFGVLQASRVSETTATRRRTLCWANVPLPANGQETMKNLEWNREEELWWCASSDNLHHGNLGLLECLRATCLLYLWGPLAEGGWMLGGRCSLPHTCTPQCKKKQIAVQRWRKPVNHGFEPCWSVGDKEMLIDTSEPQAIDHFNDE